MKKLIIAGLIAGALFGSVSAGSERYQRERYFTEHERERKSKYRHNEVMRHLQRDQDQRQTETRKRQRDTRLKRIYPSWHQNRIRRTR